MKYYYREKDWLYIGVGSGCTNDIARALRDRFRAKFNPANNEYYLEINISNHRDLQYFLKENGFVEKRVETKRKIPLRKISENLSMQDVKDFLPELNLGRKLREYQIEGIYYTINHGNCINGSDCGTGKTTCTIVQVELLDLFPCLIVCPSTVKNGWKKEWNICNPERIVSIIDSGKKEQDWKADVIIINYDILGQGSGNSVQIKYKELTKIPFKIVVADEIHFLKNYRAIRSKAFLKLAKKIPKKLGLSGTVIMNKPAELVNILKTIGRFNEIFEDYDYFWYRYCNMKMTSFGRNVSSASNIKELYEILSHYCYFRKEKRDVLTELPPIVEQLIECKINNKKIYKDAEKDLIAFLEKNDKEKVEAAEKAKHLVQLNLLQRLSVKGKEKSIELFIKEWIESNEEEKLVVFGVHKDTLKYLTERFKGSQLITGELSSQKKTEALELFKTEESCQILFANIQCIGTGVDGLQDVCSNTMLIELPTRPSDLTQAISRLERMGQKNSINVYYLLCTQTIDDKLWQMLMEKKKVTDVVNRGNVDDLSLALINSYRKK